jgi:hypothetical protein
VRGHYSGLPRLKGSYNSICMASNQVAYIAPTTLRWTYLPCRGDGWHCSIIDGLHVRLCEASQHWPAQQEGA